MIPIACKITNFSLHIGLFFDWQNHLVTTTPVNHNYQKPAMAAILDKKKVPAMLSHYIIPETLPAENLKTKCSRK